MTGEEEVVQRRKENQERREALKQTEELLRVALARIEEREQQTPVPVHITEHRICKGWGASCQQGKEAPVDLHTSVLGQGRMGGATGQSDCHLAHGDASAHATASGTVASPARR